MGLSLFDIESPPCIDTQHKKSNLNEVGTHDILTFSICKIITKKGEGKMKLKVLKKEKKNDMAHRENEPKNPVATKALGNACLRLTVVFF